MGADKVHAFHANDLPSASQQQQSSSKISASAHPDRNSSSLSSKNRTASVVLPLPDATSKENPVGNSNEPGNPNAVALAPLKASTFTWTFMQQKRPKGNENGNDINGHKRVNKVFHTSALKQSLNKNKRASLTNNLSPRNIRQISMGNTTSSTTIIPRPIMSGSVSEFNNFLKIMEEVAIHYVTLYFVNVTTSNVIEKMEESFTKYYANSQRKVHLRGLAAMMLFMISTVAYDYVLLCQPEIIKSGTFDAKINTNEEIDECTVSSLKIWLIIGLKIVFIVPLIGYTYYRTKKYTFAENFYLIWFCITIVACYPIVYNKITNDFGVSWVCLVIMYIYSCTPIRFFPCSVFCLFYLIIYVLMMLAVPAENNNSMSTSTSTTTPTTMTTTTTSSSSSSSSSTSSSSTSSNLSSDSLYVCLFYFLILLPSQSREFAIRVSYMSELMVLLQQEQLKMEETRSKLLLNSMLPESVVYQLQCGRELIADEYAHATVLFCEVCDFDFYSTKLKPQQVVELLNILFSKFDKLVDFHGVHKVETIGAVYMVVGGCPVSKSNHAELVANLALDMMRSMPELSEKISRRTWGEIVKNINIRIGINSGSLMAGVVGIRNPRFKLFGDTVNVASRMETTNIPGHIQITESTNSILSSHYTTILRGKVLVKGRGEMHTYFLKGRAIQTDSSTSVLLSANNNDSTRNNSIITTTGTTTTTTGTINTTIPTIQNQNEPSGVSHNVTTTPIAAITPTTTTTTTTTTTPMTMPMPMIMPTKTEEENPNHGNCRGSGESSGSGNGSGSGSGSGSVGGKTTSVVERRRVSTSTAETVVARSMRKMSYFDGHRPLPAHASLANLLAVTPSSKEDISSTDTIKTQTISATPTSFETTPSTTSTTMMMMENTNKPTPNGVVIRGRNRDRSFSLTQSTGINAKSFRKLSTQILGLQVNIFDIVEDTQAKNKQSQNQNLLPTEKNNNSHTMNSTKFSTDSNDNMNSNNNAEIMKLPEGLTKTEVFLRIYQRQCPTSPYYTNDMKNSRSQRKRFFHSFLSKEAHEFEENYREENRQRWMRFFRISVVVFLILKPLMTLYQVIRLANETNFFESNVIFTINFCIMFPILSAYLLYTFSPNYREWEQSSFMIMILVIAMILTVEGVASNALGHAYLSVIALYQCYFSNISFILRFLTGFAILGMYLMTYLMIVTEVTGIAPDKILVGRNALYIFIFFGAQAWVVFNSEFKQRINHFREMTLNVQKTKLIEEEARITKLLRNLLPDSIVDRLKENPEATIADFFDNVTVLFTDMVNFTSYSSKVSAMELVQFLNDMYTRFDTITEKENLYKVEIIGDAYFVVGGCPVVTNNHALAVVTAAIDMMAALPLLRRNCGVPDLNIRIGIHTGPVLAGVVGIKDPRYHLFGETVSIAHFLESSGIPGRIQISESTWSRLNKDTPSHGFKVEYRTLMTVHGATKKIRTYFIL